MITHTRCGDFVYLLGVLACSSTSWDRVTVFAWDLVQPSKCLIVPAEIRDSSRVFVFLHELDMHCRCVSSNYTWSNGGVDIVCPIRFKAFLFSSFLNVVHIHGQEQNLFAVHELTFPVWTLFPHHFLSRPFRIVVHLAILVKSVRKNFFCVVLRDLEFCPMSLGGGGHGRQVQIAGHSDCGNLNNSGASSIFKWV